MRHVSAISLPRNLPRALIDVRAEAAPRTADVLQQLAEGFTEFKSRYDGELRDVTERVSALTINGPHATAGFLPPDPEYSAAFARYFRKGDGEDVVKAANGSGRRAQIHAAMSVGTADQGGYLAPTEWDRRISQAQLAASPMRRLATVQSTAVGAYSTLWNNNLWGTGWVGETASRPETTTPTRL